LYIDDFVSAISGLIGESKEGVFNICSGKQYSVKSVIEKIKCLCGSEVNIVFDHTKDRDDFPNYICGNNKKLLNSIRWKPQYNIEQGLLETIRHYKNTLYIDEHQSASILDTSVSR
jgi:GDP-4-dehydro-6-deoxy-D-mannose reductase